MHKDTCLSLSKAHMKNISMFQSWMRQHAVDAAMATVNAESHDYFMNIKFVDEGSMESIGPVKQFTFGPKNAVEDQKEINAMSAFRELIRITLITDDFVRDVSWMSGSTLTIPQSGPLLFEAHEANFIIPKEKIH